MGFGNLSMGIISKTHKAAFVALYCSLSVLNVCIGGALQECLKIWKVAAEKWLVWCTNVVNQTNFTFKWKC